MKSTFARMKGLPEGSLQAVASRLKKVRFDLNRDIQVLATDVEPTKLTIEALQRKKREAPTFDDTKQQVVNEERYEYRGLLFVLDAQNLIASTPGGKRDFSLLHDLLNTAGAGDVDIEPLSVDLIAWVKAFMKMYDVLQLGQIVVDGFYSEEHKLSGRYAAKTLSGQLDPSILPDLPGQLRSIRFGFHHYDARRSIEARADGVLTVGSSDDEDVPDFFKEQRPLFLKHGL